MTTEERMRNMKVTAERKGPAPEAVGLATDYRSYKDKVFIANLYQFFSETLDQVATPGNQETWLEIRRKVAPSFDDLTPENGPNVSVCVEQYVRDVCSLVSTLPFDRLWETATEFRQTAERVRRNTRKPPVLLFWDSARRSLARHFLRPRGFFGVLGGKLKKF